MKTIQLEIKKTKAGDDYKLFTMEDGKKLSLFQFDTRYPDIVIGTDLPDDVLIFDPAYGNYKLKPLPPVAKTGGFSGAAAAQAKKGEMIEKAQETTFAHVTKAQENKNIGIKTSAAMRDATLMTLQSLSQEPFPNDADFEREFKKYRDMYVRIWDETEQIVDKAF